jgi:type IV secretory pathway component VirB8
MKKKKFEPDWEKTAEYYKDKYEGVRDKAMTLTALALLAVLLAVISFAELFVVTWLFK